MSEEETEEESEAQRDSGTNPTSSQKGIPPQLRPDFSRHEAAAALRPGFRNPGNKNSKAQKGRKKGRKK